MPQIEVIPQLKVFVKAKTTMDFITLSNICCKNLKNDVIKLSRSPFTLTISLKVKQATKPDLIEDKRYIIKIERYECPDESVNNPTDAHNFIRPLHYDVNRHPDISEYISVIPGTIFDIDDNMKEKIMKMFCFLLQDQHDIVVHGIVRNVYQKQFIVTAIHTVSFVKSLIVSSRCRQY